jgi:pimeloyl-ACP methyl ester carboxylesterase
MNFTKTYLTGLFVLITLLTSSCLQLRWSDDRTLFEFEKNGVNTRIFYYDTLGKSTRVILCGSDSLPTLLMIHGSPSSSKIFNSYLQNQDLLKRFRLVAIDRQGYGYSNFGKPETNILKQAELLLPLTRILNNNQPLILLSSSYGGPVSAAVAMLRPDAIDGLIMVAPALQAETEKYFWFNKPLATFPMNLIAPKTFRVANKEKLAHAEELKKLYPYYNLINCPVIFMQGKQDDIVSIGNELFVREKLSHTALDVRMIDGIGHSILWNSAESVFKAINDMEQQLSDKQVTNKTAKARLSEKADN